MDYRKFLGKEETLVLPYLGGRDVFGGGRALKLAAPPPSEGWYAFTVKGRIATLKGPADPPDLSKLPLLRGPLLGNRLIHERGRSFTLRLLPAEESPMFTPVVARLWHDAYLFESVEFESDAEEKCRRALEEARGLADEKGISAPLRAAFAYAVANDASRRLNIPATFAELRPRIREIADGGLAAASRALQALAQERAVAEREMRELRRRQELAAIAQLAAHEREARLRELHRIAEEMAAERERRIAAYHYGGMRGREAVAERAREVLQAAGARLLRHRFVAEDRLEIVFTFMDERFISLVNPETFQVLDSGICLGHPPRDDLVTLESLPSVIKEAIETDALVILRHE